MAMNILSLFSGVGGIDIGLEAAGHHTVAFCEIDPKCREILAHHWPGIPIHDDVTTLNPEEYRGRVDLVAGGSPCQDLSVAGRRAGLDGERSGLFWHQCRIADQSHARWFLWENVAGALTSNNGADFAAVLWGITGTLPDVPDEGWQSCGVVVGPKRTAVWRLFDARWFGVPQRRRRVFIVAGAGTECGPEILFEPSSSPRDSAPSGETREIVAALTSTGVGTCGADDNQGQAGHLIPTSFRWHSSGRSDTDRMTFIPMAFSENQRAEVLETPYVRSITSGGGKPGAGYPAVRHDSAVRRLTPLECERLMGWPDHWTAQGINGPIADSHRYRMCGNGVVSNITEWIGRRLP